MGVEYMKKIILLLVIFSMSIFSENLDQMPSKKALDKFIEVMKSGNFEKYSNDKQANAMFNISGMSKDEIKEMNKYKKIIGNNYKYKVTDVKETENNSEITMDVEYETVDYKGEQFQNIMRESNLKEEPLNEKTVDKIFNWILNEIEEAGFLNEEAVFIDGTHIKANANTKKKIKAEVPVAAKRYADELLKEIN